jgi:hypothetical protein
MYYFLGGSGGGTSSGAWESLATLLKNEYVGDSSILTGLVTCAYVFSGSVVFAE